MKIQPLIILLNHFDLRLLDLEKVEAPLEFDKLLPQAYILYLLNVSLCLFLMVYHKILRIVLPFPFARQRHKKVTISLDSCKCSL